MHIFNCDETGMPLNPKGTKVMTDKGSRNPSTTAYIWWHKNPDNNFSLCSYVSAHEYTIPPFGIFDQKTLNPELTLGEVATWNPLWIVK